MDKRNIIIGRTEKVDLPDAEIEGVPAKIDTGAYWTSVWASNIYVDEGILHYTLLDKSSDFYNGKELTADNFKTVKITSSFGEDEERYVVWMNVSMHGRIVNASISLSDRSEMMYPILVGRKLLQNKFLVDVSINGAPISKEKKL